MGWGLPLAQAADLDLLIQDATAGTPEVRLQAIAALGKSGDIRALPTLLDALRDKSIAIRNQALQALHTLAQDLRGLYRTVANWIEEMLATVYNALTPAPPAPEIDWTQQRRYI
jgi:hypothetical protein